MSELQPKPDDCTCQYPAIICRNMSGHAPDCPAHQRFIDTWIGKTKPTAKTNIDSAEYRLIKYVDDAKAEAHEFSYTGKPLPDTVREMYAEILHLRILLGLAP